MPEFPDNWNDALIWGLVLSVLMFVGSIIVAWILIIRMPVDYLSADAQARRDAHNRHPVWHAIVVLFRSLFGLALVIAGTIMLVTPGQGILFILLGLTLIDFPGKHQLMRRLLGSPAMLGTLNRIRTRFGRAPLQAPDAS